MKKRTQKGKIRQRRIDGKITTKGVDCYQENHSLKSWQKLLGSWTEKTVSNWSNKNKLPLTKHQNELQRALDIEVEQIDFEN